MRAARHGWRPRIVRASMRLAERRQTEARAGLQQATAPLGASGITTAPLFDSCTPCDGHWSHREP